MWPDSRAIHLPVMQSKTFTLLGITYNAMKYYSIRHMTNKEVFRILQASRMDSTCLIILVDTIVNSPTAQGARDDYFRIIRGEFYPVQLKNEKNHSIK